MKDNFYKNTLKTKDEFISEAEFVHGKKYDYNLVDYHGNKVKIKIICSEHYIFEQTPKSHLSGSGCPKCSRLNRSKYSKDQVIEEFVRKHGDKYDYSKFEYKNMDTKSIISCPKHGEINISPKVHKKHGCKKCYYEVIGKGHRTTEESFLMKVKDKHGDRYNYSKMNFIDMENKIEIICSNHGSFWQKPKNHIFSGNGCPKCNSSKGELLIENFLILNNINYQKQFIFNDCRLVNPLPFDFYLTDYNICIEFDGIQHSSKDKSQSFYHDDSIKKRDEIKNLYCKNNNIDLYRISYSKIKNIEKHLNLFLNRKKILSSTEKRENFIKKSIEIWGYKYDYSEVKYIDYRTPVKIGYKGLWYKQTPQKHLQGRKIEHQESRMSNENFISLSRKIWGDRFDYSNCEYLGTNIKVRLFDKINKKWIEQTAKSHLKGFEVVKLSKEEFLDSCQLVHDFKYKYDLDGYKNLSSRIKIDCPIHGEFELKAASHIYGSGCSKCVDRLFNRDVKKFLDESRISFFFQHKFEDCKNIYKLPFDFYIPSMRTCIEFDGIQHFQPVGYFGGPESFKRLKINDKIKEDYCEENFINLIRIRWDQIDKIDEILWENLKTFIMRKGVK